jgi:hypothetical protein
MAVYDIVKPSILDSQRARRAQTKVTVDDVRRQFAEERAGIL